MQERESVLFALALEKPLVERATFLQTVRVGDDALQRRLEALLAATLTLIRCWAARVTHRPFKDR
jgi:hypothetical protein